MDFLGKEGERAAEAVQNLSQRLEDLESHLNAVDSAVQDNSETTRQLANRNQERVASIEEMIAELVEIQRKNIRNIDTEDGKEENLERKFNAVKEKLRRTKKSQEEMESRMKKVLEEVDTLEDKIFRVEDELTQEIQLNQSRIDNLSEDKISKDEHEKEVKRLEREISKLKTSLNALSGDDEGIRVE